LARGRHLPELTRHAQVRLIVHVGERLDEEPILRSEVVEDQTGRHATAVGDVLDPRLGEAAIGDDLRGRLHDLLVAIPLWLRPGPRAHRSPLERRTDPAPQRRVSEWRFSPVYGPDLRRQSRI